MLKVFVLTAIVWNGGQAGDGVLSKVFTFSSLRDCEIIKSHLEATTRNQFPASPIKVECRELVFGEGV